MKVRIVKEVKRSDGLWRFACGDVFYIHGFKSLSPSKSCRLLVQCESVTFLVGIKRRSVCPEAAARKGGRQQSQQNNRSILCPRFDSFPLQHIMKNMISNTAKNLWENCSFCCETLTSEESPCHERCSFKLHSLPIQQNSVWPHTFLARGFPEPP